MSRNYQSEANQLKIQLYHLRNDYRNLVASMQKIVADKVLAARRKYFYAANLN